MGRVKKSEVRAYQDAMGQIERNAKQAFYQELMGLDFSSDNLVDLVLELVSRYFSTFGEAAAEAGREFYQFCVDREVDERATYYATSDYDYENTRGPLENQVQYYLDEFKYGRMESTDVINNLSMTLGDYINKENRRVILENINQENLELRSGSYGLTRYGESYSNRDTAAKKIRARHVAGGSMYNTGVAYMRVPTSGCACAFCMTMASRGAVYWTRESAGGEGNKFHDHCRCSIVRVSTNDPFVDGYDHTEYLDMYDSARDALANGDLPDEAYERIEKARERAKDRGTEFTSLNEIEIAMRYMYGLEH